MAMTEQQIKLGTAAQNGDVKSFEELYVIYNGKIYALAKMILKNPNDAEDILQETFISAWRKLATLDSPQTFSVWLQIIARNLCVDQLKRKNIAILLDAEKEIENFDDEESDALIPAVYAERADLKERLGRIIDGLSDVQRQVIVLYYFNELTVSEIAAVMHPYSLYTIPHNPQFPDVCRWYKFVFRHCPQIPVINNREFARAPTLCLFFYSKPN